MSTPTTRDQAALDATAEAAMLAGDAAANAWGLTDDPDARATIEIARDSAYSAARLAVKAGAKSPGPPPTEESRFSLRALASLDSPEARELHRRLAELLPLAERVDDSRGRTMGPEYEPQPGESRGTDVAETLSLLVLRLRNETIGPAGRE